MGHQGGGEHEAHRQGQLGLWCVHRQQQQQVAQQFWASTDGQAPQAYTRAAPQQRTHTCTLSSTELRAGLRALSTLRSHACPSLQALLWIAIICCVLGAAVGSTSCRQHASKSTSVLSIKSASGMSGAAAAMMPITGWLAGCVWGLQQQQQKKGLGVSTVKGTVRGWGCEHHSETLAAAAATAATATCFCLLHSSVCVPLLRCLNRPSSHDCCVQQRLMLAG